MSTTCELIRDPRAAEALAPEWDTLADEVGAGPLVRPAYALAWWRHLGRGQLLVAVVRDAGRLVALAPLHERRVGPVRVARWLGHGLGTVSEVLVLPGHEESATDLWTALATPRRVLELVETRAGSGGLRQLEELEVRGRRTSIAHRDRCPVADLEDDGLALVRRPGAKNLRKTLKRAERQLAEAHLTFRLAVVDDLDAFDAMLPDIRSVFDAAEAEHPRQHLLRPPYEAFYLEYMRGQISAGNAVVLGGYIGDQLVTFRFALMSADTLSLSLGRFDPGALQYSPGHLLYRETYRWAASHGLGRVDLLLGESQTKSHWSTGAYDTLEVTSATPGALACLRAAARTAEAGSRMIARLRR
jgi:CelD/BcsL family acetyltransferase involved in cellulose biosynthesis